MKRYLLALALLLVGGAGLNAQTVTVTGHMKSGNTSNVTSKAFMRFRLRNFSGNTPRVTSTGAIVQTQFDVAPDNTGTITTTLYGNDVISPVNTFWTVETWYNGVFQFSYNYGICASTQVTYCSTVGATFNLDSASPISFPTPPAPYLPLPGPTGPTGPQGPIGPQGPPGAGGSGPTLQTNNGTNASQTLLNLLNGTNVTMTNSGGGVTVNAVPGTPAGCLQYNSSSTFTGASGICTPDGNSLTVKGPNPVANLAAFTRVAVNNNGCSTTATISLGTPTTATLNSAACFQIGDGITIYGAGAAAAPSSPSAPTVTPNTLAVGGTAMGGGASTPTTVVNGSTGSSTYEYLLVARDKFGGFAAPSAATTITNGPSTLGEFTCNISTMTRSGRNVTVTFTAPCAGAVAGAAALYVASSGDTTINGYHNVQTVNSSSQIVFADQFDSTGFGWNNSANGTNSATGGTAAFFNSNHLQWTAVTGAWEYYVCAERPGDVSFHRIGVTKPSTSVWQDIQFDDYGATMMASITYPSYITDSVCNGVAGQNDPLTATITNLVGTTATLDTAATNAVTGATAVFDNGPGLVKAARSVSAASAPSALIGGELFIGPTSGGSNNSNGYIINSYIQLPSELKIRQAGTVYANETIELSGLTTWDGSASSKCNSGLFGYYTTPSACVYALAANPVFYVDGGDDDSISNLSFNVTGNVNGVTDVVDDSQHSNYNNVIFNLSGGTNIDFLGTGIVFRGDISSEDAKHQIIRSSFTTSTYSTNPASWTPFISMPNAQNAGTGVNTGGQGVISILRSSMNQRGFVNYGQASELYLDDINRQSGVMPLLWNVENSNSNNLQAIRLRHLNLDTDGSSLVTESSITGSPSVAKDIVDGVDLGAGAGLPFNGYGPAAYRITGGGGTNGNQFPNRTGVVQSCVYQTTNLDCNFDSTIFLGPNAYNYYPLAIPSGFSANAAAGGSLPSDTWQVAVSAVGPDGNETTVSSSVTGIATSGTCPGSGSCEITASWSSVPYASSYNFYECSAAQPGDTCVGGLHKTATGITTTSYTMTTFSAGANPQPWTKTGQSVFGSTIHVAPYFYIPEGTAPSGLNAVDQLYGDSTAHAVKECANGGSCYQLSGFTISPTNTDCVDWSGTAGLLGDTGGKCGHYTITPTNGDCVTWSGTGGLLGDAGAACGTPGGGMDTNMDNMANPTLMNHSLVPASVNTIAVGAQLLPFTNIFLGTVANQAGSFDTSALTANHVIKFPNADSTAVQNCASVSHEWISQILQSTGACTQTQPTLADVAAGASPAGLFNFSGSTMEIPQGAGFTAASNSTLGIDTTAKALHSWINAADAIVSSFASAPAGSKCVQTSGTIGQLTEAAAACGTTTPSSSDTFTNKTYNAESTGNALSEPVRAYFGAGGCNNSTASNGFDIGVTNAPTPQCAGTTVRKGVLQFARGNVAYLNFHLPSDWNSSASTDIEIGFTTSDTTNGHVTSFNVQTACNKVDGTVTDDPSLNASQALSVTTGASQTSGGELTGKLTSMTMTGCAADYNFEIVLTRNNSGVDTNTDTAVAVKFAEIVTGVTKNAANR